MAQLAGGQVEKSERNLLDEARVQRIADIENRANCLAGIWRVGKFVKLVSHIELRVRGIRPKAVRFPAVTGKVNPITIRQASS